MPESWGIPFSFPKENPAPAATRAVWNSTLSERAILEEYACRTGRETVTAEEFFRRLSTEAAGNQRNDGFVCKVHGHWHK